ncbi:hypothetical protein [Neptunitalea lumnitzerae]|uniref:Uncharacterized protein n=1 Tax=Neptunitalea lumnitzerae TaxID=2965509 RepID=A0ABQ5MLP4_9FLAO|nr:hypothetical protein [Neptunitalea sp. Y10]GLB49872.1 hypothetical protein Y10_22400 [Neptunitalea sp. Y10]
MSQHVDEIMFNLNKEQKQFTSLLHSGLTWQTQWTKLLKTIIKDIGEKNGFFVNTGGLPELEEGEWMFDLVWSKLHLNGDKTTIIDIPLVLESEISKISFGGFKEDFDKLLVATNSLKVFVTRTIKQQETLLKECIEYAQDAVNSNININSKNGVYLIIWKEEKGFTLNYIKSHK